MIRETMEKVQIIRERLLAAHSHQKAYADRKHRPLEFVLGEHVFLRILPMKGVVHFGKRGKLNPRFVGPFEVLERVGEVTYKLALLPSLSAVHPIFHVSMLRRYIRDDSHVIAPQEVQTEKNLTFEEEPVAIVDR